MMGEVPRICVDLAKQYAQDGHAARRRASRSARMAIKKLPSIDPASLLAQPGEGRSTIKYR
jgi:hypothetical protein